MAQSTLLAPAGWHGVAHGPLLSALANPAVSVTLGSVALLGPGRPLIRDGLESLLRWGSPLGLSAADLCRCSPHLCAGMDS